jgi:hypothetical protein
MAESKVDNSKAEKRKFGNGNEEKRRIGFLLPFFQTWPHE